MRVIRIDREHTEDVGATVVALGFFDGVHRGHRLLLDETVRRARAGGLTSAVFTFTDEGARLKPDSIRICTEEERYRLLFEAGIDVIFTSAFSSVSSLSPEAFVSDILLTRCHAAGAVCGFNYRFGACAAGDTDTLRTLMDGYGEVSVIPPLLYQGLPVSSTRIRAALLEGDIPTVTRLLGRPYILSAPVLHGKALGRTLGIPTINQTFPSGVGIPRHGVYAVTCDIDGETYLGVANVGLRPTVDDDGRVNCETHIVSFEGDLYGRCIKTTFLSFLRPEIKFSSVEELSAQIQKDIRKAETLWRIPNGPN